MLCDVCGKNEASMHLTEIVNGEMTELHLCEKCAAEKSMEVQQQFGLADLLAGLSHLGEKAAIERDALGLKCPNCRITYEDFRKAGRLGCSECYNAFRKYLAPLLRKIHGSTSHTGKSPRFKAKAAAASRAPKLKKADEALAGPRARPGDDVAELKAMLQKAIASEEYEEAARLRDKIRELEKRGK